MLRVISVIVSGVDITFEDPLTPLESALNVLKSICRDMKVPQRDHDHISNSIKEMVR